MGHANLSEFLSLKRSEVSCFEAVSLCLFLKNQGFDPWLHLLEFQKRHFNSHYLGTPLKHVRLLLLPSLCSKDTRERHGGQERERRRN